MPWEKKKVYRKVKRSRRQYQIKRQALKSLKSPCAKLAIAITPRRRNEKPMPWYAILIICRKSMLW